MKLTQTIYEGNYLGIMFIAYILEGSSYEPPSKIEFKLNLLKVSNNIILTENVVDVRNYLGHIFKETQLTDLKISGNDLTLTTNYRWSDTDRVEQYSYKCIDRIIEFLRYKHFCIGSNTYCPLSQGYYINEHFISDVWIEENKDLFKIWKIQNRMLM
ncbi:MAG: hypothetical protein QM489_00620 [Candidatus Izemoplasma sp.]